MHMKALLNLRESGQGTAQVKWNSLGAYVIKISPVGILWSKQATSLDMLFGP